MHFLLLLALLYFLPTILASNRGHAVAPILLLNLFLGWTLVGWFLLLLWALLSCPRYRVLHHPYCYCPPNYRHR